MDKLEKQISEALGKSVYQDYSGETNDELATKKIIQLFRQQLATVLNRVEKVSNEATLGNDYGDDYSEVVQSMVSGEIKAIKAEYGIKEVE